MEEKTKCLDSDRSPVFTTNEIPYHFQALSKNVFSLIKSHEFIRCRGRQHAIDTHIFLTSFDGDLSFLLFDPLSSFYEKIHLSFLASTTLVPRIISSYSGLICIDTSPSFATSFLLYNPDTPCSQELPMPLINDYPIATVSTGFGCNCAKSDLKLVRVISFQPDPEIGLPDDVRAEVYSHSTDSWKVLDHHSTNASLTGYSFQERQPNGVSNGEHIYWVVNKWVGYGNELCCEIQYGWEVFSAMPLSWDYDNVTTLCEVL